MRKVVDGHEQLVIGVGDYHDKEHPANSDQRIYLESLLKKCRSLKSKLIVEDLSSVNSDGKGMCCNFSINARGGVLGKLADAARAECIDVDNVEYRFCRVAGVGPLIHGNSRQKNTTSAASISMKVLCSEFLEECSHIHNYNDGTEANRFYKKIVDEVFKAFCRLKIDKDASCSIADYCSQFYKHNYVKYLERLCIFDSSLIDAKIMHSILISPEKTVIIIAAGGSHIEKVNSLLEVVGYHKIAIPAVTVHSKQIVENSLNAQKSHSRAYRPLAVNMHVLDQFIR